MLNERNLRIKIYRSRKVGGKRAVKDLLSTLRVFLAKGSIKHTSNSAIITLFIYNKERNFNLIKSLYRFRRVIRKASLEGLIQLKYWKRKKHRRIYFKRLPFLKILYRFNKKKILNYSEMKIIMMKQYRSIEKNSGFTNYLYRADSIIDYSWRTKTINDPISFHRFKGSGEPLLIENKVRMSKKIEKYNRYLYLVLTNKKKFEKRYLENLRVLASKIYNKNVTFNFIRLKKYYLNSNIYTQIITLKLKNRDYSVSRVLGMSLNSIKVPHPTKVRLEILKSKLRINKIDHNIVFDLLSKTIEGGHWFEHLLFKYNNAIVNPLSWFGLSKRQKPDFLPLHLTQCEKIEKREIREKKTYKTFKKISIYGIWFYKW